METHASKIIGICGHPGHGKTTVQELLQRHLGVTPIDDSRPLRYIAMDRFQLTWDDVSTQRGKSKVVEAYGRRMQVREAIGLLGKEYEREDPNFWVNNALSNLHVAQLPASFGSIRMDQGAPIRALGGIVIHVTDPWRAESVHDFDQFNEANVSHRVVNCGTVEDLARRVLPIVQSFLEAKP